jgi:hypothetical protein
MISWRHVRVVRVVDLVSGLRRESALSTDQKSGTAPSTYCVSDPFRTSSDINDASTLIMQVTFQTFLCFHFNDTLIPAMHSHAICCPAMLPLVPPPQSVLISFLKTSSSPPPSTCTTPPPDLPIPCSHRQALHCAFDEHNHVDIPE